MEIATLRTLEPRAMFNVNLADQIHKWSDMCGWVLAWERENIIVADSPEEVRRKHRGILKDLLRWTRIFQAMLADADVSESLLTEIEGRALQLESSWKSITSPMDDAEAASVLREAFSSDADKDFANTLFPHK